MGMIFGFSLVVYLSYDTNIIGIITRQMCILLNVVFLCLLQWMAMVFVGCFDAREKI